MDNNKRLTPEEIVRKLYNAEFSNLKQAIELDGVHGIYEAMKQYAAQEVAEKDDVITEQEYIITQLSDRNTELHDCLSEKDAMLKEARLLLYDSHARLEELATMKRLSVKQNPLELKIIEFLNKTNPETTGSEARKK
jgi:predicted nuclease with TOPRIM domain